MKSFSQRALVAFVSACVSISATGSPQSFTQAAFQQPNSQQTSTPKFVEGEFVISVKSQVNSVVSSQSSGAQLPRVDLDTLLNHAKVKSAKKLVAPRQAAAGGLGVASVATSRSKAKQTTYLISMHPDDVQTVLPQFEQHPDVDKIEPNYLYTASFTAEDPYFSSTGAWGQSYQDLWGAHRVNAPAAWATSTGEGVLVAVVDSGLDLTHPDIASNVWTNPGEIPDNGIDDDGNGYIDDVTGYSFSEDSADMFDDNGHGTHVAGTIAAVSDNFGMVGVAPQAKIMPVRALNGGGGGTLAGIVSAVHYAVDNGAQVINASLGGARSDILDDAVTYAYDNGVVFVAAAGNEAQDIKNVSPAGASRAITVAATMPTDEQADFSNYGNGLDVAAPGTNVLSALAVDSAFEVELVNFHVGDAHLQIDGTSMAAPHVAGVVALLLAQDPTLTPNEIDQLLKTTADPIGTDGWNEDFGYGIVDASNAINNIHTASDIFGEIVSPDTYSPIGTMVTITGTVNGNDFDKYYLDYATATEGGEPVFTNFFESSQAANDEVLTVLDTTGFATDTDYLLRLRVADASGKEVSDIVTFALDHTVKTGWPQPITEVTDLPYSWEPVNFADHATLSADLNGDGEKSLIVAAANKLHAWNGQGQALTGFPVTLAADVATTPTIADLNDDGLQEIIVFVQANVGEPNLYVYDNNGQLVSGFPVDTLAGTSIDNATFVNAYNPVMVTDLNGDDVYELVVSQFVNSSVTTSSLLYLTILSNTGDILDGWPKEVSIYSGTDDTTGIISAADVNHDGEKEIFISVTGVIRQYSSQGHYVTTHYLDPDVADLGRVINFTVADTDRNGQAEFIILSKYGYELFLSKLTMTGEQHAGWPRKLMDSSLVEIYYHKANLYMPWPISIADIDGDNQDEIFVTRSDTIFGFDAQGSTLANYPQAIAPYGIAHNPYATLLSPLAASPSLSSVFTWGPFLVAVDAFGNLLDGWPKYVGTTVGAPNIDDLDNDGLYDISVVSAEGLVYIFEEQGPDNTPFEPMFNTLLGNNLHDNQFMHGITPSFAQQFDAIHFRGTPNGWAATPMQLVADNTWQLTVNVTDANNARFKFDRFGDWSENYGDNNNDGIADQTGNDIVLPSTGDFVVTFNDVTLAYSISPAGSDIVDCKYNQIMIKLQTFTSSNYGMLCEDGIWRQTVWVGDENATFELTTDTQNTLLWGDDNADNVAGEFEAPIVLTERGNHTFTFNAMTLEYSVTYLPSTPKPVDPSCARFNGGVNFVYYEADGSWGSSIALSCANGMWSGDIEVNEGQPFGTSFQTYTFENNTSFGKTFGDIDLNGFIDETFDRIPVQESRRGVFHVELNDSTLAYSIVYSGQSNQFPTAVTGEDMFVPVDQTTSVKLISSDSFDVDGEIVHREWTVTGGILVDEDTDEPTLLIRPLSTAYTSAVYSAKLTVTDDKGAQDSDFIKITQLVDGTQLPIADAGDDMNISIEGGTLTLDASNSSSPAGGELTYRWQTVGGNTFVQYSDANAMQTEVTFPAGLASKQVEIMLIIQDETGNSNIDIVTVTYGEQSNGNWQRTVIFMEGQTQEGQDMFMRGGIDWDYALAELGIDCSLDVWKCAVPIRHLQFAEDPQRANDTYLDWYGAQDGQGTVEGSPLVWTTNNANNDKKVAVDGYGYTPLNRWGDHYWMLEVEMDCSQTVDGWFELKSFISNGPEWEDNVDQQGTPWESGNHFAQCGKLNVFKRNVGTPVTIEDL